MLKQVIINNYQSHKNTELDFHKGVNVFIGNSDSGKSALMRAMKWVFTNKPLGDSFRSHWGGDTSVDVVLSDEITISREKGKNNIYIISGNKGKSPQELKAPGSDVPELAKRLLNLDEINIQNQLDGPFLLSSTSGEVAKYLNQLVNLEKIDLALSRAQTWKKQANDKIKIKSRDLELKEESLKKFDHLEDFEKDVKSIEKKQGIFSGLKEQYVNIFESIRQVENIQKQIKEHKKKYPSASVLDSLLSKIEEQQKLKDSFEDIRSKIAKIESAKGFIQTASNNKKKAQIQYDKLMPNTCPLCEQKILKK